MSKLTKLPRAEQWATRITAQLSKTVEAHIETGRLLMKAKSELVHGEWLRLFDEQLVPFGERTAQMLMAVATHPILSNTKHASDLPPSWYTLYELTKVPEPALKNALHDGLITPDMERKHVKALLPVNEKAPKPPAEFHWMNAIGDLKDLIERTVSKWPAEARVLVPRALRDLAESLESEHADRGNRKESSNASGSAPLTIDISPAS